VNKVHDHLLQVLFPVAVGWGLALTFAEQVDRFGTLGLLSQEHPLYWRIQEFLAPAIVILSCGGLALVAYRLWPGLLRVPASTPWKRLVKQLLVCTLIVLPAVIVISGLVGKLFDPGPTDPGNPQYVPLWFYTMAFYPYAWTPAVVILTTAWSLRRRPA